MSIRRLNPLPSQCPVCGGELEVVRVHCPTCDTSIEGHFSAGRFGNLTPQQWHFVETFIRCKGKIKDVEVALDISYPTVVSRLNDVIRTLGFETADDTAGTSVADEKRRDVLDRLNQGKISAKDALRLLEGDAAE